MISTDRPVLLVDDDPDDRFIMNQAWHEAGVANPLMELADGAAALAYLAGTGDYADRARFPMPALVLLDISMPGYSGLDVLARVRASPETALLPVLMLTASAASEDVRRAYHLGANTYFVKPSSIEELTALLKTLSLYWLRDAQLP